MGSKQILKLFIALALCTSYIFSFSHFGVLAYETFMNKNDSFTEGTFIGPVNVSGKTKSEAIQMIEEQLLKWLNETEIGIQYKEKKIPFDPNSIVFDVGESVNRAIDGQKNSLMVYCDEIERILSELSLSNQTLNVDLEKVEREIFNKASMLEIGTFTLRLEDFLLNDRTENDYVTIETTLEADLSDQERSIVDSVGEIQIAPKSQFSMLSQLEELGVGYASDETLSIIASGIYEVILQTNFPIIERHISESLPFYAKLGYEAKINPDHNIDLVFVKSK